jgi:hypothetical protein
MNWTNLEAGGHVMRFSSCRKMRLCFATIISLWLVIAQSICSCFEASMIYSMGGDAGYFCLDGPSNKNLFVLSVAATSQRHPCGPCHGGTVGISQVPNCLLPGSPKARRFSLDTIQRDRELSGDMTCVGRIN